MDHPPRLRQQLRQLAEEMVPDEVDLWPHLQARLRATRQGTVSMNTFKFSRRWRWLALPLAAVTLGLAVVAATPQGRILAQRVWQFFTPAAGPTFPVPVVQLPAAEAPTAAPPAGLAGCEGLAGAAALACQTAQAEAALGFDLVTPAQDVPGLEFVYAQVSADPPAATVVYNAVGGGAGLALTQGRGPLDQIVWEAIPPEALVEPVQVLGLPAEYVRGTFVVYAGAREATWNPDAPVQRLRWRAGDTWFELRLDGGVEAVAQLDRAGLIALAESLR